MKKYELVCILDPQVGEGQYEQAIEKYETYIKENGGEITQMDNWGLRRLAYTSASLKNRRQGYYVIFQFAVEPTMIDALEQTIKLDDGVLRYLLTGVDGDFIHVPQFFFTCGRLCRFGHSSFYSRARVQIPVLFSDALLYVALQAPQAHTRKKFMTGRTPSLPK